MPKKRNVDGKLYDVGYGKPPIGTRWKPGISANPAGRRKGSKNFLTIAHEVVTEKVVIKENGKSRKVTYTEALLRTISRRAANGEKHSTLLMFDLIGKIEAKEQRRAAQQEKLNFRMIDSTMTPQEASDAYAETLEAIRGIAGGDIKWNVE